MPICGIKVGDYVNYNPASGNGAGLNFTSSNALSGTSISGTFNSSDLTKWRVLSIEDGKIKIIPEQPTTQTVRLNGADGYINAKKVLNNISKIYGQGEGAVGAKSIKIEDLEDYFKFDKTNFENSNSSTGKYGGTKNYDSGSFIVNGSVVSGPQIMTQTSYYYNVRDYNYSESENADANKVYSMLFKDINTNSTPYWLATTGVDIQANNCRFDVLCGNNSNVGRSHLYTSNGSTNNDALHVIPVVTLASGVRGEKDEDGTWSVEFTGEIEPEGTTIGGRTVDEIIEKEGYSELYGKKVKYAGLDENTTWRVFYVAGEYDEFGQEEGTIYLKADQIGTISVGYDMAREMGNSYNAEKTVVGELNPEWYAERKNSTWDVKEKCTAYLCDPTQPMWGNMVKQGDENIKWITGAPSAEMYVKSYSQYKNNSYDAKWFGNGYRFKTTGDYKDTIWNAIGLGNEVYRKTNESWWFASASYGGYMCMVGELGQLSFSGGANAPTGICPVVCLKSGVHLELAE